MDIKIEYSKEAPTNQTIVNIFEGAWYSAFPDEYGIKAGSVRHFDYEVEPRVKWANGVLQSGLKGAKVLELGPFEAYNTWQLEDQGAASVLAIEANNLSYLKCLIVKEIVGIKAHFLYGDFISYLEQSNEHFDVVWASGVLYHQTEPLHLLELISRITDKVFIHTHYYDQEVLSQMPGANAFFIPEKNILKECHGYRALHHYRSYNAQQLTIRYPFVKKIAKKIFTKAKLISPQIFKKGSVFSGGPEDYSCWLEKKDIFDFLKTCGYQNFKVAIDDPKNPNGPGIIFTAER